DRHRGWRREPHRGLSPQPAAGRLSSLAAGSEQPATPTSASTPEVHECLDLGRVPRERGANLVRRLVPQAQLHPPARHRPDPRRPALDEREWPEEAVPGHDALGVPEDELTRAPSEQDWVIGPEEPRRR